MLLITILILTIVNLNNAIELLHISDYRDHPCIRNCDSRIAPLLCEYNFTLEWYSTLSKACYKCPFNVSDCYRPQCVAANGVLRTIMTVNRMLPGPSIQVCKGDIVSITVSNDFHLSETTSIHWHGLLQRQTPYMDGVSMVTQCPILPHTSFRYTFIANDIGTHFWHAHSGIQRQDGVFGSFIIRANSAENKHYNKYDFDLIEHVIIVTDWLNDTAISKFVQHHHNGGDNKPDAILINGRGVYYENQLGIRGVLETPRSVFNVEKGYRYRFRLIAAGSLYCPIMFSIDNHNLTVISSDGEDIEPIEVQTINIISGERYDFILNCNQEVNNYWIKTKGLADCSVKRVYQTAILNYKNASLDNLPDSNLFNYTTINSTGKLLNPWNVKLTNQNNDTYIQVDQLRSLDNTTLKYNATVKKKFYLSMEFNKINNYEYQNPFLFPLDAVTKKLYTPQINNISMMLPPVPALYQWDDIPNEMVCNAMNKEKICPSNTTQYCSCVHVIELNLNDLVELVVVDEGFTFQSNHPMHLHGFRFAVIGIEKLNASIKTSSVIDLDNRGLLRRNYDNPPLKDTVTVPVGGYTVLRFIADNPGTWLFHCHLEFHSEVGMTLMFKVGGKEDLPKAPIGWPTCGSYPYEKSSLINNVQKLSFNRYFTIILFLIVFIII